MRPARTVLRFAALVFSRACLLAAAMPACGSPAAPPAFVVLSVSPQGRETPLDATVTIHFARELHKDAPATPGLVVKTGAGNVAGSWALADDHARLVFRPAAPLWPSTLHGIHLPGAIASHDGETLGAESMFSFTTGGSPTADTPPVLRNLAVRLDPWDPQAQRMGDVLLTNKQYKPFLEFGAQLKDGNGQDKALGEFTFISVVPGSILVSPIDGIVDAIDHQSGDSEIRIRPSRGSNWIVILDHVDDVKVKVGDQVSAGQAICASSTAFEISVAHQRGSSGKFAAPFTTFDPALAEEYQNRIWSLMERAEAISGHPEWYDEAAMRPICAGCLATEMPSY